MQKITIGNIEITVTRKKIKNLHLRIIPPGGDVTISAPYLMSQKSIERFALSKLGWINRHRERILSAAPSFKPQYLSGERHLLLGKQYELNVVEGDQHGLVTVEDTRIILNLGRPLDEKGRAALLEKFYARQLEPVLVGYIRKYEQLMNVRVKELKMRKMKTRWGTCNPSAARLRFNLELARKPLHIVEYIVLHEMVHLLETGHNKRFYALMERWMPQWKDYRKELRNITP